MRHFITAALLLLISTPLVAQVYVPGNPKCSDYGLEGFKLEGIPLEGNYGPVTVTSATRKSIAWTSTEPVLTFIVKGGNGANVWNYLPPGILAGTGISPHNNGGNQADISHVSWCFGEEPPPPPPPPSCEDDNSCEPPPPPPPPEEPPCAAHAWVKAAVIVGHDAQACYDAMTHADITVGIPHPDISDPTWPDTLITICWEAQADRLDGALDGHFYPNLPLKTYVYGSTWMDLRGWLIAYSEEDDCTARDPLILNILWDPPEICEPWLPDELYLKSVHTHPEWVQ